MSPKSSNAGRSLRVPTPRPEHADALRRLARRLGEDPDAPPERGATAKPVGVEALSVDPERRAEAALSKCEGLLAGRTAARRLAATADALDGTEDAVALQEALAEARRAESGEAGCPHRAAGFASGFEPAAARVEARIAGRLAEDRRARLLEALREILADEIDDARRDGAEPQEAAQLLLDRRDLVGDLPISSYDLGQIGRSIAEEAAADPRLAEALRRAARGLETPSEDRAATVAFSEPLL